MFVKPGRYGPYVQLGDAETPAGRTKPKMASLFKTMDPTSVSLDDALRLLSLPRVVGTDPERRGDHRAERPLRALPQARADETRSLTTEEQLFTVTVDEAMALLRRAQAVRPQASAPVAPLRSSATDPVSGKPIVVKDGRFGPYVTDGETNASLRRGDDVETITIERAAELLAGPAGRRSGEEGAQRAKKATAKKAAKKKATAKKPAKKAGAKKAAARSAVRSSPLASV